MKVVLTALSNRLFETSRTRLGESAKRFGITDIRSYDFEEIKNTQFYKDNEEILSHPKTMGHWLWKPYIISEALKDLSDDDIVIYCDAGIEVVAGLQPLITKCKEDEPILLFGNCNYINANWTKRDCFILMDCDSEKFWYGLQCDAALSLFRKGDRSEKFINEWLKHACNKNAITDIPNISGKENLRGFIEHRHDQSILSLLAQKYGVVLYRMPTQFGNHYKMPAYRIPDEFNCVSQTDRTQLKHYYIIPYYNSSYGQLLDHHRSKRADAPPPEVAKESVKNRGLFKSYNKRTYYHRSLLQGILFKFGFKLEKIQKP